MTEDDKRKLFYAEVLLNAVSGDKPLSYVKEAVFKASSERMDKFFNRFGLSSFCRR